MYTMYICYLICDISLQWCHNGLDGVSNHQPHHCLLSRLFGCRSKKTSKLCVTGLCAGNSPGTGWGQSIARVHTTLRQQHGWCAPEHGLQNFKVDPCIIHFSCNIVNLMTPVALMISKCNGLARALWSINHKTVLVHQTVIYGSCIIPE